MGVIKNWKYLLLKGESMDCKTVADMYQMFSSVVIWGLCGDCTSTQRHVHRHMYNVLKKIGVPVFWCSNNKENNDVVQNGSLIISSVECCDKIRYNKANWYAMCHTYWHIPECRNYIHLYVYGASEIGPSIAWDETTLFNKDAHIIAQAFTTDLLPDEFYPPTYNKNMVVNWVGSVWNDEKNQGNIENIEKLRAALQKHKLELKIYQNISDLDNILRIRESRIAPAIGGEFQTKAMMPCRIWKNISYGHLCATNLAKAVDIFYPNIIYNHSIDEIIDHALSIGEKDYIEGTKAQQEIVAKNHTYLNWLYDIARALVELGIQ
jgi:hypothetical protein